MNAVSAWDVIILAVKQAQATCCSGQMSVWYGWALPDLLLYWIWERTKWSPHLSIKPLENIIFLFQIWRHEYQPSKAPSVTPCVRFRPQTSLFTSSGAPSQSLSPSSMSTPTLSLMRSLPPSIYPSVLKLIEAGGLFYSLSRNLPLCNCKVSW